MTELKLLEDMASAGNETPATSAFPVCETSWVLVAGRKTARYRNAPADTDSLALVELRRFMQQPLSLQLVDDEHFKNLLAGAYEQDSSEAMQMMGDLGEGMDLFSIAQQLPEPEDLLESEDDAPIIRLINALLTEAVKENASDIHIEPFENRLVVRFRVDGVLREVLEPQRVLAPLVSRIKVMARLDIASACRRMAASR
jgi:general secretion pathway protein E